LLGIQVSQIDTKGFIPEVVISLKDGEMKE
jgi:hypothetical protein